MNLDDSNPEPLEGATGSSRWVFVALGCFVGGALIAYVLLGSHAEQIPEQIRADPLLVRGHEIYLANCVNCHGPTGLGDGPLAINLTPRPSNLAKDPWKYGDKPDQVMTVLTNGVKDAQMPAFAGTFSPQDLKAVAAYIYEVAGKPVPESYR